MVNIEECLISYKYLVGGRGYARRYYRNYMRDKSTLGSG